MVIFIKKIDFKALLVSFLAVASFVLISMIFTKNTMDYYLTLKKPSFAPKPFLFPICWSILYFILAVTLYAVRNDRKLVITLFINLLINIIWPILFFRFNLVFFAIIWLGVLIISLVILLIKLFKSNRTYFYLNIPYLLWCLYAFFLNCSIYSLNK